MRILTVVGARPQFIKAAVLSRALRRLPGAEELLLHTGQHYDPQLSDVFFRELQLPLPRFHLGIGSGPHGEQTGRMLAGIEAVLREQRPDWVVVYGDTNSTLAGALAAVKLHLPVAHVEAGLRSGNRRMPEEINRVLTDHAADLLLAPTRGAVEHLRREGLPAERIHLVGDVMYDAALHYAEAAGRSRVLTELGLIPGQYVLATVHRAENTDDPARLTAVLEGLAALSTQLPVVLPLHPRTRAAAAAHAAAGAALERLRVLEPVGYLDMTALLRHAALIATDSGGVQKEAYFHRVPCVTLRQETEWPELVEAGWNVLVPPTAGAAAIAAGLRARLGAQGQEVDLYGDGQAGERIAALLAAGPPGPH